MRKSEGQNPPGLLALAWMRQEYTLSPTSSRQGRALQSGTVTPASRTGTGEVSASTGLRCHDFPRQNRHVDAKQRVE